MDRNAYMREWSRKNRERLQARQLEKVAALRRSLAPTPIACSKCGRQILLTPQRLASRRYRCNACRNNHTPEQRRRYQRADYWKNHEKYLARGAVSRAVNRGLLVRQPCERCGIEPAQAHHSDYSKPLDVKWLCQWCHNIEHIELKIA